MKTAEAIAKQMKDKVCYCCGRTDNITIHHLRDIHFKTKSGKGMFNGYILLCRDCHDFVEVINLKHKESLRQREEKERAKEFLGCLGNGKGWEE